MSYSNMNEYTKFVHTDEYSEQLKNYTANASGVKVRNPEDKDFKDIWSDGIKMNWDLVPVEKQKPHIGWRQSINDDGSYLKTHKLASYQYSPENNGSSFGKTKPNVWIENKNAMDQSTNAVLSQPIASGKTYASDAIRDVVNGISAKDWMKALKQQSTSSGLKMSSTAVGCLAIAMKQDGDISSVVSKLKDIETTLASDKIENQIITAACYAIPNGLDYFLSTSQKKIDSNPEKTGSSKDNKTTTPTLNRSNINSWKWTEFAPLLSKLNVTGLDLVPKICYSYSALNKYAGLSRFDTDAWGFVFTEEQIESGALYYSSGFGQRPGPNGSFHHGIDLPCPMGTEVHCVDDGVVHMTQYESNAGQITYIDHGNNKQSRYMHTSQILVSEGQTVSRGDVIALSGIYRDAPHLHVELITDGSWNGNIDPAGAEGWPLFQTIEDGKAGESFGAGQHNLNEY